MTTRARTASLALLIALLVWGCGEDQETLQVTPPSGLLIQDFPIVNGATWTYQNRALPEERYRISVEGTRNISGANHWKLVYTKVDAEGKPLIGVAPEPADYYAANGLHRRQTALTRTPGVFSRAIFIGGRKAAAAAPFPIAAVYVRATFGGTQKPLTDRDPIRYDETTEGTLGIILEAASEGVDGNRILFQKHLPPRRMWQFPLRTGERWVVFQTPGLPGGVGRNPQPPILAERRVAGKETVDTPAYSGTALRVDEWVVGLQKDEAGNLIIPSLDDTDGDGTPDRGEPTARYWVAKGVGVVQYEYEFVDLGPPPAFTRKTFVLVHDSIPEPTLGAMKTP